MRACPRRWAAGDANRVIEQEFALERIGVTDWRGEQRLVLLVGIAYGFIGFSSRKGKRVI